MIRKFSTMFAGQVDLRGARPECARFMVNYGIKGAVGGGAATMERGPITAYRGGRYAAGVPRVEHYMKTGAGLPARRRRCWSNIGSSAKW